MTFTPILIMASALHLTRTEKYGSKKERKGVRFRFPVQMTKLISAAAMFVGSLLLAEASFGEERPMREPKALFSTMQEGLLFSVSAPKEFKAGLPFMLSLK